MRSSVLAYPDFDVIHKLGQASNSGLAQSE